MASSLEKPSVSVSQDTVEEPAEKRHRVDLSSVIAVETDVREEVAGAAERIAEDTAVKVNSLIEAQLHESQVQECILRNAGKIEQAEAVNREVKKCKIFLDGLNKRFKKFIPLLVPVLLTGVMKIVAPQSKDEKFSDRAVASAQLKESGITPERASAYTPGLSEAIYRGVAPYKFGENYDSVLMRKLMYLPRNLLEGRSTTSHDTINWDSSDEDSIDIDTAQHLDREDAWRLYLGLAQKNNTFGISEYQPEKSKEDKYYYKINDWLSRYGKSMSDDGLSEAGAIRNILHAIDEPGAADEYKNIGKYGFVAGSGAGYILTFDSNARADEIGDDIESGLMGRFKLSRGEDERGAYISYYDRWDLGGSIEGTEGFLGKPFEIYDRIYYDKETLQIISNDPSESATAEPFHGAS